MNDFQTPFPLLQTKLIPPAPGASLITRPRISATLDRIIQYPLTTLTAPAGSGKTTALVGWVHSAGVKTAWLALEPADSEGLRFWTYAFAAIHAAVPDLPLQLPVRMNGISERTFTAELDGLCNLLAEMKTDLVLVLDDLQYLEDDGIWKGLAYLVDHAPACLHLVLSSRKTPDLPLGRWRAANRLLELRKTDLFFSPDEADTLLNEILPDPLDHAQLDRVHQLTRGWPAGLRLMALSLKADPARWDAWREGRALNVDYLTREVLQQTRPELVATMSLLSVPQSFDQELARELTHDPKIGQTLDAISAGGYFLDHTAGVYSFHPFFREALLAGADPAELLKIHADLAGLYLARGQPDQAVDHYLEGKCWSVAAELVNRFFENKLQQGEIGLVSQWFARFPAEYLASQPDLAVAAGFLKYLSGDIAGAINLEEHLKESGGQQKMIHPGWWDALECQLALLHEENQEGLALAQSALLDLPADSLFFRGMLLISLANAQQATGDFEGAITNFKAAVKVCKESNNLLGAFFGLANLGIELNNQGHRRAALALCLETLDEFGGGDGPENPLLGIIHLLLVRLYWEASDLESTRESIARSRALLAKVEIPGILLSLDYLEIIVLLSDESYPQARQILNRCRQLCRRDEYIGYKQMFDALYAQLALTLGNLDTVEHWLEEADLPHHPDDDPSRESEYILQAKYLLESNDPHQAEDCLERLEEYCRKFKRGRLLLSTLLVKAQLEWKQSQAGLMKQSLEEALAIAVGQDYLRALVEDSGLLLGVLARMTGAPAFLRNQFPVAEELGADGMVEFLTGREGEVLRLLARNCTNQEIAAELVISIETVKVHLKHIFQKLGAANRREAIRRAGDLGLTG